MPLSCVERCQPLLGTFVRIRVAPANHAAIDAAFAEIAEVHRLMSFHETESDVSRLNREAAPVAVDPRTYEVLQHAEAMAQASDGTFDVTVAPAVVAAGALPHPGGPEPDPQADWRDIALLPAFHVQFLKPLWIDLGGIAKGYAVDRAMTVLKAQGVALACVNAGGDLRVMGRERVRLVPNHCTIGEGADVEVEDGAIASSCGGNGSVHIDPHGCARGARFVCVAAPSCIAADALTKIVMARGACSTAVLAHYGAHAMLHDAAFGWRQVGVHHGL